MIIQVVEQDSTLGGSTAYDSIWAQSEVPVQERSGIEQVALADDKVWVVLAVVLIIWIGLIFLLFRTDRKIDRLERKMAGSISSATPIE